MEGRPWRRPRIGVGGLTFDAAKRHWPPELNVFLALVAHRRRLRGAGPAADRRQLPVQHPRQRRRDLQRARLSIIILQVSIVGIIAIGVTQVIITGGIDLSLGLGRRRHGDDRDELRPDRDGQRQPEPQGDLRRPG